MDYWFIIASKLILSLNCSVSLRHWGSMDRGQVFQLSKKKNDQKMSCVDQDYVSTNFEQQTNWMYWFIIAYKLILSLNCIVSLRHWGSTDRGQVFQLYNALFGNVTEALVSVGCFYSSTQRLPRLHQRLSVASAAEHPIWNRHHLDATSNSMQVVSFMNAASSVLRAAMDDGLARSLCVAMVPRKWPHSFWMLI